jgi:ubiquinol-cytochrome c reductase iron-sulfur subunit
MTGTERWVALAFVVSALASIALVVLFVLGGQPQLEGILLATALGALGAGIVAWAIRLLDAEEEVEERHPMASTDELRAATAQTVDLENITRRGFLVRLLVGAGAALAAALAVPAFALGPSPGRALFATAWRPGVRVVGEDGMPIRPEDLALGSVRTVFPETAIGSADAVTLLVRVRPSELQLDGERRTWAPEGAIGYSKICTHAGCPVGLYRAEDNALLCPCHQSTFDVLRGAVPTFGPAARPLPQLPMELDDDGYLVARGDFPEPVGPSFWNLTHRQPDGPEMVDDADPGDGGE